MAYVTATSSAASVEQSSTLEVGDAIPIFPLWDQDQARFSLREDRFGGRVTILALSADSAFPAYQQILKDLNERRAAFDDLEVMIFAVTKSECAANREIARQKNLTVSIAQDRSFALGRAFGLSDSVGMADPWRLVVLDERQRVSAIFDGPEPGSVAELALAFCRARKAEQAAQVITSQPPVLIVPNLISPEHGRALMDHWARGERFAGGVSHGGSKYKASANAKIREDLVLPDLEPHAQDLFAAFRKRLFPEILKAFKFHVTRAETLRIGCYDAEVGGKFLAHRDDSTSHVRHRSFAMSLFLNSGDYEGGYLRFPEYGPQLYRPEPGGAVVFSCSLLHEVTPVTAGRRFGLFGFFHGEEQEAARRAKNASYEYTLVDQPVSPRPKGQGPLAHR